MYDSTIIVNAFLLFLAKLHNKPQQHNLIDSLNIRFTLYWIRMELYTVQISLVTHWNKFSASAWKNRFSIRYVISGLIHIWYLLAPSIMLSRFRPMSTIYYVQCRHSLSPYKWFELYQLIISTSELYYDVCGNKRNNEHKCRQRKFSQKKCFW